MIRHSVLAILLVASRAAGQTKYTPADVHFMQGMIDHHAQAIVMAAMIPSHTNRSDLQALGERITVSQRDEIASMRRWLRARHEDTTSHAMPDMPDMRMPGMLTAAELAQLERSRGAEFTRMFLTFMIRHHEGAITMVTNLFATQGGGQDSEIFRFASDVEADQRAEIARMRALLTAATKPLR